VRPLAALLTMLAVTLGAAAQETRPVEPPAAEYARTTHGTRWLEAPGVAIKVLVEASNFGGGDVEIAELRLEPGSSGAEHRHGSHELIYLLEGVLDHVVNGAAHRLEPGMVAIVKQGDAVAHRVVSPTPVRALLVWAPGGEAERLAKLFKTRPVE
jgi:quercetin dioxygenase-like cupin family protein